MILKDKNILVGVTGSIAIYKSLELIRLYIKAGANVRVIMTESAKKFINPITFEVISQNRVLDDTTECWEKNQDYNHIDIGKWSDIFVIAPISANSINKLSNGVADNLLLQTALAYKKTTILSPAANTNMIENPITQKNLANLYSLGFEILDTQVKELACKDIGNGAMSEPIDIFHKTCQELFKRAYWSGRKVVLSGGGTIEKIDDVRYISNFSSGKMASSLATALYYFGADVTLVASRGLELVPNSIEKIEAFCTNEFKDSLEEALSSHFYKKPYLFMVAAISDYIPKVKVDGKIKKDSLQESWNLELKKNIDILATIDKRAIYSIGFKAEMDKENAKTNAENMLKNKNLDAVCLNVLDENLSFGDDKNIIELIFKDETYKFSADKLFVSFAILQSLEKKFETYE